MDINIAMDFAREKHSGQKRKDGSEYIIHPFSVANRLRKSGYSEKYQIAGLFHDLLEDTDATEEEIKKIAGSDVLEAVKLLTKTEANRKTYIKDILSNEIAKAVKNQDRIDNLNDLKNSPLDFVERYLKNTEREYLGKFSDELDQMYYKVLEWYDSMTKYEYTIDASLGLKSPIYRTSEQEAWIYRNGNWEPCDPMFWVDVGDNATSIPADKVEEYIH